MSGVDFDFKFPDLKAKVENAKDEIHLSLAAGMQTNRALLFDAEGNYNGHEGWAPLVFRRGMILSDRGTLRKSLAPRPAKGQAGPDGIVEIGPDVVTIGTNLKYAAMMNWGTTNLPGGVLRPTKAQALRIPIPKGDNAAQAARDIRAKGIAKQLLKLEDLLARRRQRYTRTSKGEVEQLEGIVRLRERIAKLQAKLKEGSKYGGDNFIFVKSVKIPARRYDQISELDRQEFNAILTNKVAEVLAR